MKAQSKKLFFHHLNSGNGLAQASCVFIYRDAFDFVWISSTDGLMRYDGQSIRTYRPQAGKPHSLFSKNVQSNFFEDGQGNLWFTTYDAIQVYRRQTDDFEHFFIQKDSLKILEGTYGILFNEPGHRLAVIVNNDDLYWIDPEKTDTSRHTIHQIYAGKVAGNRCLAEPDALGRVRTFYTFARSTAGAPGFGKYVVEGDSVHLESRYFDGANNMPPLSIKDLLDDHRGNLWLATHKGLVRYEKSTGKWAFFNNQTPGKKITSSEGLALDGSNWLWVSTNLGLAKLNLSSPQRYAALYEPVMNGSNGPAGTTSDLYLDKAHVLWSSILGIGVDYTPLDKTKFSVLTVPERDGNQHLAASLEEDLQGDIWIGSNTKNLKKYTRFGPRAGAWTEYPHSTWKLLSMPDERMFVATMDGFSYVLDIRNNTRYPVTTAGNREIPFSDVCMADNQTLWGVPFVDNGGLWRIKRSNGKYEATRVESPLFSYWFTRVYQDRTGQLYLAQEFTSLLIYRFDGATPVLLSKTGLRGEAWAFYEDEQYVWAGGEFGLCRIDKKTREERLFEEKDGMLNSSVYGILPQGNNYLWLSTNRGITRFQKDSLSFRQYSPADGLQDLEFNITSFLKTRDGKMWFGGTKGINVFHPDSIDYVQTKPVVQITNLLINDQPFQLSRNVTLLDSLEFSYEQNTISLDFVAIEYSDPANNKLQYRMYKGNGEAYDDNWVTCTSAKGFARYSNLPHGAYTLHIRGANSDGVWNTEDKLLFIRIRPHYTQTTQFWFFVISLSLLLLYLAVRAVFRHKLNLKNLQLREQRLQIEKQEALTQERNRIAAEMHDDFGSGLTAIQRISERTAAKLESTEAKKAIENITSYSLELIANMREIIWAMSGKNDNLENLMAYISDNAYRYLEGNNIQADIIQPEEIPDIEMTGERRRNIYLAVKESLHNVVKHAHATSVTVSFEINGMLEIHVADNGKGFNNNNAAGNGMGNMLKRMQDIGGNMSIENNGGTHLIFSVPIENS